MLIYEILIVALIAIQSKFGETIIEKLESKFYELKEEL